MMQHPLERRLQDLIESQASGDESIDDDGTMFGIFVYGGNWSQAPNGGEPAVKLMQLGESLVVFESDREQDDCKQCEKSKPFTDCDETIRFCHEKFDLSRRGIRDAVESLLNAAPIPGTAFLVSYNIKDEQVAEDIDNEDAKDIVAQSLFRFQLDESKNSKDEIQLVNGNETSSISSSVSKPKMWIWIALVALGLVLIIVGIVLFVRSKKKSPPPTLSTNRANAKKKNRK